MKYKCIKDFSVNECDDNGFTIENEYENVEVGSVWETGDAANMMVGGLEHIRLENIKDGSWLEIPKEQIDECFEEIPMTNKEAVEELLILKRTVKANSDADKALDKAIERLRLSNDKSLKESDEVIPKAEVLELLDRAYNGLKNNIQYHNISIR